MISVASFLECVKMNAARTKEYAPAHDGSDGKCDCIGLIIGAIRLAGGQWNGTHGSNYAMRNEVDNTVMIESLEDLHVGQMVAKAKEKHESGWSLPSKYSGHPDQRDYYHVGVVMSVHPLVIMHCTSMYGAGGIFTDTQLGKWRFAADLKKVNYGDTDVLPDRSDGKVKAIVTGGKLNLRSQPSTSSMAIAQIPSSSTVDVISRVNSEWAQVEYGGKSGYVMTAYLIFKDSEPLPTEKGSYTYDYDHVKELINRVEDALGDLKAYLLS